jgi:tetratricopeptide (TPR) repeat protein
MLAARSLTPAALLVLATGSAASLGCAGHSARTLEARAALDAGQPKQALALYNEELEVESEKELPEDVSGENALLILDRSMILQQLEKFPLSSRDLETADKQIEMLDFARSALDDIGKYVFSDETGPYKAPPYEKLMINTMNMVNYLAQGDLAGARVEARRLAIMQKYLRDHDDPARAMNAPGSYFAGFVFEKSGDADEALRYYDEALGYGSFPSLVEPVRRLQQLSGYDSPRLRALSGSGAEATPSSSASGKPSVTAAAVTKPETGKANGAATATALPSPDNKPAELLVVISYGRVPAKIAKRVPIGLALTYASGFISPTDAARANELAAQGLVTWVNYPDLEPTQRSLATPGFALDGKWQELEGALAVDREAKASFDRQRGAIIASAITRMISRLVAGQAARAVGGNNDALGLLLSLGTQAALTATDTPDTRSWATLPARIVVGRVRVPAGEHRVLVQAQGVRKEATIKVPPGGWAAVTLTVLE